MPTVTCIDCHESREVVRARKRQTRCLKCSIEARRKPNKCSDCGADRHTSSPLGRCKDCYLKNRTVSEEERTRTCVDCGDKKVMKTKSRIKKRCASCSAKKRAIDVPIRKNKLPTEQNYINPRVTYKTAKGNVRTLYLRTCTSCENSAYVSCKPRDPDNVLCSDCSKEVGSYRHATKKRAKHNYPKNRKLKIPPKEAIEKAKEINREHKESIANNNIKTIPIQKLSDDDMVAKWLETNEPKKDLNEIPINEVHLFSGGLGTEFGI